MAGQGFMDLFETAVNYPLDIAADPFPRGMLYCYVSSTLLDGMINYVEVQAAYLITRYRAHSKNVAKAAEFGEDFHSKIGSLEDDVLILARANPDGRVWWFFWYDCDVSDCQIGRFQFATATSPTELLACFAEFAETRSQVLSDSYAAGAMTVHDDDTLENEGGKPAIRLDPKAFRGWVGW